MPGYLLWAYGSSEYTGLAAGPPCGTGWYVKFPLEGDDGSAPKPQLSVELTDDLSVVIQTHMMDDVLCDAFTTYVKPTDR